MVLLEYYTGNKWDVRLLAHVTYSCQLVTVCNLIGEVTMVCEVAGAGAFNNLRPKV